MEERYSRTCLLIGEQALEKLKSKKVAIFGVGGVGGFVLEGLSRSGIGEITIIDKDDVSESNLNRQIIATKETVGLSKVEVAKNRVLSIDDTITVNCVKAFFLPENADSIDFSKFDYVIDAVDTVSAKTSIIEKAKAFNVPVISCMGTGGKLNPELLTITTIEKTSVCPLAKVMRGELKNRGITGVKVVYSTEEGVSAKTHSNEKIIPSMVFVPAVAGLLIANEVVKDLIK